VGQVLIINMTIDRGGGNGYCVKKVANRLKNCFESFGLTIFGGIVHENPTVQDFEKLQKDLVKSVAQNKATCAIVVIMAHGGEDQNHTEKIGMLLKLILIHQESAVRKMSRSKQLYLFNQVYPYIPFHVELQDN
jgi:hypothetical protein